MKFWRNVLASAYRTVFCNQTVYQKIIIAEFDLTLEKGETGVKANKTAFAVLLQNSPRFELAEYGR